MRYIARESEDRYRRLSQLGKAVDYAGKSFEDFDLRPFLDSVLPTLSFPRSQRRALEYGTGTGAGACYLAALGFQVDAIDISPTAIKLAKRFAAERNLSIHYSVQDICNVQEKRDAYDLVVDNFCLHRLATDRQRSRALSVVHSVLRSPGYYIIGSVVFRDDRDYGAEEYDKQTGIVYLPLGSSPRGYEDAVQMNSGWFVPRARHVRPTVLAAELQRAGFRALRQDGGKVLCTKNIDS